VLLVDWSLPDDQACSITWWTQETNRPILSFLLSRKSTTAVSEEHWPPAQGEARRGELAHTVSAYAFFFFFGFQKTFFLNCFFLFFVKLFVPYCHSNFLNFF
jgi:hypothetical protein